MSENDDFIKIFMHFNVKTRVNFVDFYTKVCYTMFSTFKEA